MIISFIVAADENWLIGKDNALPWHLPSDLKRFKSLTMGKPMIMGRKTHESIGRPLPGRSNIVMTRDLEYRAEGCVVVHSIEEALAAAGPSEEVMVIGGGQVFEQLLGRVTRVYLTRVEGSFEGDVYFPELVAEEWTEVSREEPDGEDRDSHSYSFAVLERKALEES